MKSQINKKAEKTTWTTTIKKIEQQEGPGIARLTVEYSDGKTTFEKELKLAAEHFQSMEDVDRELARHTERLDNFEVTIEMLKDQIK